MTETMIERAARALSAPGDPLPYHHEMARGVIEAMREPTEAAIAKALESEHVVAWGDYREFWTAMIDAALSE